MAKQGGAAAGECGSVTGELNVNLKVCGQCKTDTTPFLHYIKHRGIFRRLCTACILRFNSQSFCPICFFIYNPTTPLEHSTTPCSKCYSISHSSCIGPNPSSLPYVCPLCTPQTNPFCQITKNKVIDKKSAAALLAAARISYDSMSKAALVARTEAEKRSKEAWSSKKRAREAIQHVAVVEEENLNKGCKGVVGTDFDRIRMDRVENSSAVLASLNAVELNDKEVKDVGGILLLGGSDGFGRQLVPVVDEKPVFVSGPFVQNNHPRDGNGGSYQ